MSLRRLKTFSFVILIYLSCSALQPAAAQTFGFKQSVAQAADLDRAVHKFYKARNYQSFWTGDTSAEKSRLHTLIKSFSEARLHGLPTTKFNSETLISKILASTSFEAIGQLDVELTIKFLEYARVVQSGILVPSEVDEEIVREVVYRDPIETLVALEAANAAVFFKSLPPQRVEYTRLMKEKMRFERLVAVNGWGSEVAASTLGSGDSGAAVIGLRNRLIDLGHMQRTFSATYNGELKNAVRSFQEASGLLVTGLAGNLTMEEINVPATKRLAQIMVAMERERWLNQDLGDRHILVNLTDFTAKIMDFGKVTFQTNSVVGAHDDDRRSPEFSDSMEHIIVNPSWYVPRSIIINEYLPMLQMDPTAVDFLELRDDLGNVVERAGLDFNSFDEETFPFGMRQPPSVGNALGLVKFMFPNSNNIYLHDTPAKNLFGREVRAFSHGCIRLENPFGFANALLTVQSSDPEAQFQEALDFGEEVQINLDTHIPVHIIYRTAVTLPGGGLEFRRDIYGRDAKIWEALQLEGVVLSNFAG